MLNTAGDLLMSLRFGKSLFILQALHNRTIKSINQIKTKIWEDEIFLQKTLKKNISCIVP